MSRTALRSFIQRIHFYGGMFVGPFILIAALTGCLYALAPTLENFAYRDVMTVEEVNNPVSLEDQISAAQKEHPEMPVSQVWPAESAKDSTRVLVADPGMLAEDGMESIFARLQLRIEKDGALVPMETLRGAYRKAG